MRGRKPVRPLTEVADAAVKVFTDKGFRTAGISDVSAAMGLSHGALYTYVDSKRALLYLALLRTIRPEAVDGLTIPVAAPPPDEFVALLKSWVARHGIPPVLDPAGKPVARSAEEELGAIIDALYDIIEGNRLALQLIERCAADLPEVAQWYFVQRRRATLEQIGDFLRTRIESGELRPVPDTPTAARYINETIAWFAMHRHGDPDSAMLDDDACRRTVRHLLLASFLPAADFLPAAEGNAAEPRQSARVNSGRD
jgi:AcrR family transcriptional regulator